MGSKKLFQIVYNILKIKNLKFAYFQMCKFQCINGTSYILQCKNVYAKFNIKWFSLKTKVNNIMLYCASVVILNFLI